MNRGANGLGRRCGRSSDKPIRIARPYHRGRKIHRIFETLRGFQFGNAPRFPLRKEQARITVAQRRIAGIDHLDMRKLNSKLLRFLFDCRGRTHQYRPGHSHFNNLPDGAHHARIGRLRIDDPLRLL